VVEAVEDPQTIPMVAVAVEEPVVIEQPPDIQSQPDHLLL
jgi:hypothetical protein